MPTLRRCFDSIAFFIYSTAGVSLILKISEQEEDMMTGFIIIVQKSLYPQIGALYLANALSLYDILAVIVDSEISCEQLDRIIERVDPIAIGCSVMTTPEIVDFVRHSLHVQRKYNAKKLTIPVIWGGTHSTIMSEQTAKEPYINLVVSGEAEITLPELLTNISRGKIPQRKLVYAQTPHSLDQFRPHWEMCGNLSKYLFEEAHSVHADVAFQKSNIFYYLLTSRGCTYKCNFCWEVSRADSLKAESKGNVDLTWRSHSCEWIEQQFTYVQRLLAQNGICMDGIGFWDDMFFGRGKPEHTARAEAILRLMQRQNFGYLLEARANQLISTTNKWNDTGVMREADLYKFLKETGCMQVLVGAESGNQDTLNLIKKGTKIADYLRLVELSQAVGLPLRFSIIVGFPDESEKSINDTLDFIERLESEPLVSISGPKLFTPYPGTQQFESAVRRGMRVPNNALEWARINRYSDYRRLFPWLSENCSPKTLRRIDDFFSGISADKTRQPDEEAILKLLRAH